MPYIFMASIMAYYTQKKPALPSLELRADSGFTGRALRNQFVYFFEQHLARFKLDAGAGVDHAGLTVAGVATGAFGLEPGGEGAKALEHDFTTVFQFVAEDGDMGIQVFFAPVFGNLQVR